MAYSTLFGRRFQLGQSQIKPLEGAPMGDKSEAGQRLVNSAAGGSATPGAAGGGFRGMFMRKNLPRTLQIFGAALQDINGSGNLAAFQGNEADQLRQSAEEMAQARTGKIEDQRYTTEMDWRRTAPQRERDQYMWQRQYDAEHPEGMTAYQQAQLATTRRGQDLDYAAASARVGQNRPLRGPDASLMTRARESAESQRGLRGLVQEFSSLQQQQPTGPGAGLNPFNGGVLFDRETRAMDALSARMLGLMRPTGSGATSDFEQRIYARGAPSIDNTPDQNAAIINGIQRATEIADARQFFYEQFAEEYGNLNMAEQAFQASPEYRSLADPSLLGPTNTQRTQPNLRNANRSGPASTAPQGVTQEEWDVMTPEERALFQ